MSGNMLECDKGPLPIGLHMDGLTRGYTERHIAHAECKQVAGIAMWCCFISFINLWIHLHKVAHISICKPASFEYAHYFWLLWAVPFFVGEWVIFFFLKARPRTSPPTSEELPHPCPQSAHINGPFRASKTPNLTVTSYKTTSNIHWFRALVCWGFHKCWLAICCW